MALTRKQIVKIQTCRRRVEALRDEATWRFFLRNCAGVHRDYGDNPRLSHVRNGNDAFEEIMERLEALGGTTEASGYWQDKASQRERRLRHAIREFSTRCEREGLLTRGALPTFVERMTKAEDIGDKTDDLERCNLTQLIRIAEGLKGWMRREAKHHKTNVPTFGGSDDR